MAMIDLVNEYKKVEVFENTLSRYTGSPYVVCVDSCTSALLLSLLYIQPEYVVLPNNTYVGVAMAALNAGCRIEFTDYDWSGIYKLSPVSVYDSAKRLTSNMYIPHSFMCLSFHYKKHLKIGKGGAILTDNKEAYEWFCVARNNGKRIDTDLPSQRFTIRGHNMVLHPDLAVKGTELLKLLPSVNEDLPYEYYGNLSQQLDHSILR